MVDQTPNLPNPQGMSTFDSPAHLRAQLPGGGQLYRINQETLEGLGNHPELGYFRDGRNFSLGGNAPGATLRSIPKQICRSADLQSSSKNLPWEKVPG